MAARRRRAGVRRNQPDNPLYTPSLRIRLLRPLAFGATGSAREAGLPAGIFNVVHGDKAAVEALLGHPAVAAMSFVGSTPIAQCIYTRGTVAGKRVQALGGAKNHAINADGTFAAEQLASAAFGSAGERCIAISAAVAVGSIGDDLVEAISRKAASVKVGPGTRSGQ